MGNPNPSHSRGWPKTGEQLRELGYHSGSPATCKGCGKPILWASTPNGKMMPLTRLSSTLWQPHWIDCQAREQFKKRKEKSV